MRKKKTLLLYIQRNYANKMCNWLRKVFKFKKKNNISTTITLSLFVNMINLVKSFFFISKKSS